MEIKVKIEAPELASALSDIAIALSAIANLSNGTPVAAPAAPVTEKPPAEETTELKPADAKKKKIADEIVALGGTPPEKGSVAKFEAALEEAKKAKAEEETGETTDEEETGGGESEQEETGGGESEQEETTDEAGEDVSLDDVRTLAHALIKSTPDNPALGKTKLGACLKKVGAKNLTEASQKQLNEIVPLIENNVGKTLADVLAEAAD